ncbi:MAG: NAD-dependent epimerase/dehydratase [Halieaceae bacterium]|nr:NAD-dependent epimerase/dehydratase [Halieaceae bacterium]
MRILVTGACGYKGTVLVSKLLRAGYEVIAFDIMWFGNYLNPHDGLRVVKGDVRDTASVPLDDVDAVIHLSSVANDPCGDLDPRLTWEISCLSTMRLADRAVRMGIERFIYASSGSVYGVKTERQVTEDLELLPLSEYNKTKMVGERVLLSYSKDMIVQIVRPATVCGLSPRMRLDVSVNLLTMQALTKNEITILGGDQTRPNIHIDDITDLYLFLLRHPELQGIYNAGFENMSINEMALMIQAQTSAEILRMPSNDPRSYRLNSDKLLATGFSPKKNVDIAIKEICVAYEKGELENKPQFNNLLYMQTEVLK